MEWILRSPQIHSTFGNLGYAHSDGYHVNENCHESLSNILHNLLNEDKYLRTYRKSISFGQYVQKDIIPLIIHSKDDKTVELLVNILVELTIPIECLLSFEINSKTDFGRHTIFEINNLLASIKNAFMDQRVTKVLVEFLKKNLDFEKLVVLTPEQCTNTANGLLLLRNVLHIPYDSSSPPDRTVQNQIIWNIFSQSIDKVLIKLMTIPEATNWSVTMVQLIALLYKDQHAVTLRKLLNQWLDEPLSASSEDNESNTSPQNRSCENSSQMLTSDPTSDSSDTNGSGKNNGNIDKGGNTDNGWTAAPDSQPNTNNAQTAALNENATAPETSIVTDNATSATPDVVTAVIDTNLKAPNANPAVPEANIVANDERDTPDVKIAVTGTEFAVPDAMPAVPNVKLITSGASDADVKCTVADMNSTALDAIDTPEEIPEDSAWPPPPPPPPPTSPADHTKFEPAIPATTYNRKLNDSKSSSGVEDCQSEASLQCCSQNKQSRLSAASDCGYGTQVENQELISTSSNEDEPCKPVHQKPHHPKQKPNTKARIGIIAQDRKKKKVLKRAKSTMSIKGMIAIFDCSSINLQGLSRKTPTDDDIANIMKEFTVDFLLKGYNSLVQTLHSQIVVNKNLEIDTSHFFWLVTYFLKFAMQIELDVEHLSSVLSFDLLAYLTAEGVNLCEQFELALKLDAKDLKALLRRLHLVVTSIREFLLAVELYEKQSAEGQESFLPLKAKMVETDELRLLMVLLLRHYSTKYHNKQYLQDLIVTNHILLSFVDNLMKAPGYKGKANMVRHLEQFATPEMMAQYAVLLEDYENNGEFVNDCIFTMMHHVAGDLRSLVSLFQPKILKIFITMWKSEFEVCDDWTDLIHQMINTFIKRPCSLKPKDAVFGDARDHDSCDDDSSFMNQPPSTAAAGSLHSGAFDDDDCSNDKWTDTELSSLSWNYMQCNMSKDTIGEIVKLFKEDGVSKSRDSVIKELYKQNLIHKVDLESLLKTEKDANYQQIKDARNNDISKLCNQLIQDNKVGFLEWIQKALLDTCFAKIYLEKKSAENPSSQLKFECFKKKHVELPLISPVSYHSLLINKAIPLVPWNFDQASICKDLKFLQLVHKLGFIMPVDSGKVFIRIPNNWSADTLYDLAGKILPIHTSELNFSKNDIPNDEAVSQPQTNTFTMTADIIQKDLTVISSSESFYRIHKQYHQAAMVNFTPMPGTSLEGDESTADIKRSWLEIVQRSQELKITMQIKNEIKIKSESRVLNAHSSGLSPTLRTPLSVDPFTAAANASATARVTDNSSVENSDSTELLDDDDNVSMCGSASVASDLTRMYVSDEEDKPLKRGCRGMDDDDRSDDESCSVPKRARLNFQH